MNLLNIDQPYVCFEDFAPTELMALTENFYESVEKVYYSILNKAIDNDAFGNKSSYCSYYKLSLINTLYTIIFFIYMEKKQQVVLYEEGKISEVQGDAFYHEKYGIGNLKKQFLCIGVDLEKVFNSVNFDGQTYITGIGYMYINPSDVEPIFTIR